MEQLGPYQLVKRLGRGGMGTVYEGVHTETGDRAAVKVLAAPLVDDAGFRERFDVEIEALRKLNHPGIVSLIGHGETQGQAFYVMELVEGANLEQELARGRRFDWREVVHVGLAVCRALRHAHDRGIIHRDIKPGNLLFAADGSVKLSDFGIARLFGAGRVTGPGSVLGTVEYMAPEQAQGIPMDARADLYSLGCVLYTMLARRPPYQAATLAEMLALHRSAQPEPIARLASDVPEELQSIIAHLLQHDPGQRVPNATVLARRLEALLDESAAEPPPVEDLPRTPPAMVSESPPGAKPGRADDLPETKESLLVAPPLGAARAADPDAKTLHAQAPSHFTPVDRSEPEQPPVVGVPRPLISAQTWLLVAGLIALAFVLWYLMQPPTADDLYDRIARHTADGDMESLLAVESQIDQFLLAFPGDSRAATLRKYSQEIQLYRLERKFDRRALGLIRTETLLPVERDYLEAIHYGRFDPERAMRKLQAILDLYDHHVEPSTPVGQCLQLVRRRLERLRDQVDRQAPHQAELVEKQLLQAEKLFTTDPARARSMCEAVIELFSDKPWAAEWVRRARRDLQSFPNTPAHSKPAPASRSLSKERPKP
jgi:serine/threonine-protein kinase